MKIARLVVACLPSLVVFSSCTAGTPAPTPVASAPAVAPKPAAPPKLTRKMPAASTMTDGEIRLRRTGCYGRCPAYRLTILGDGAVEFEGERYVAAQGPQRGQADPQKLAGLRTRLRDPEVAALASTYTPYGQGQKHCGQWATDAPTVTIEIGSGEGGRRIEHYQGCEGAPALLRELEDAIDDTAGVGAWISGQTRE